MAKPKKHTVESDIADETEAATEGVANAQASVSAEEAEDLTDEAVAAAEDDITQEIEATEEEGVDTGDTPAEGLSRRKARNSVPDGATSQIDVPTSTTLGLPPLSEGESSEARDKLRAKVSETVKPADFIEELWVNDFVYFTWEIDRHRRHLENLLLVNRHKGLKIILDTLYGTENAQRLADSWAIGDPDAVAYVEQLLAKAALTMEDVMSQTLSVKINDIERIDGMIMKFEMRRNSVLREVDRRRATLGDALRKASEHIEDAEFTEIGKPQIEGRRAA